MGTSRGDDSTERPREKLLAGALQHFLDHGIGESSLREIAAALGTSHRMLIYHFGSRQGLLLEVARACEAQQREALGQLATEENPALPEVSRAFWVRITDPQLAPLERLFFEIYSQALQGQAWAQPLLSEAITGWLPLLTDLYSEHGAIPPARARARARLSLAIARGLLLDLLATGDNAGVDAAFEEAQTMFHGRRR